MSSLRLRRRGREPLKTRFRVEGVSNIACQAFLRTSKKHRKREETPRRKQPKNTPTKARGKNFEKRPKMIHLGGQKGPNIVPGGLHFASGDALDRQEPANRAKRPQTTRQDQPKTGPRTPRSEFKRKTRGLHTCRGGVGGVSAGRKAYPGGFRPGKN